MPEDATLLSSLRASARYLRVRPTNLAGAFRLFECYLVALGIRFLFPSRFSTIGRYLGGREPILYRFGNIVALVRPRSEDLGVMVFAHEPKVSGWFHPGPGELVVDVGAHVGTYTLRAAKAGAKVIAIEPNPESFRLLETNVHLNSFNSIITRNVAVGAAAGVGWLSTEEVFTGRGRLTGIDSGHGCRVTISRLDDLLGEWAASPIDWLKIDVEGSEYDLMLGAKHTLERSRNLIIEVSHEGAGACRQMLSDFPHLLLREVDHQKDVDYWYLSRDR
jgi:FkbM family methyltransferase